MSDIMIRDFDQMVADTLDRIVSGTSEIGSNGITNIQPGSVIRTIVESILSESDIQYYQIDQLIRAMSIDTAEGDDLRRLLSIFGIVANPATSAIGIARFSRTTPYTSDIRIEYGQVISTLPDKDGNTIEFIVTDQDAVLTAGQLYVDVNVQALEPGVLYLPSNMLTIMNTPIPYIESVTNPDEIVGGSEEESDDSLRARGKNALALLGKGTLDAIKSAIQSVEGVVDVSIVDMPRGAGTVDVYVTTSNLPPPQDVVDAINAAILSSKSAGILVSSIYPDILNIDVNINTTGFSDIQVIGAAIVSYCDTLTLGGTFIINQMERYVLNSAPDIQTMDITTIAPASNTTPSATEIIRAGTITVNGEVYTQ